MRRISQKLIFAALAILTIPVMANTFQEDLKQVDAALKNNPSGALRQSLESCLKARNHAVVLDKMGQEERARRALQYCFDSLQISSVDVVKVSAPTQEELQAKSYQEYDKALTLTPDVANGLAIYRECAACHEPEGWGHTTGSVPQIAGQHRKVVIKQLADFRAGNRDSVLMAPYATVESIGGTQALADVAEYISTLEMSVENGKGPGTDLELGESLYRKRCMNCHGENGEGSNDDLTPRIQAQHYKYMLRQFQWMRDGKRRNANPDMVEQIKAFSDKDMQMVINYVSRIPVPKEKLAPSKDWLNPDFD